MEWIVFQSINSEVAPTNYYNSIKIAYLLNLKVVSVALDDGCYFFSLLTENSPVNIKLEYLINSSVNDSEEEKILLNIKQSLKDYEKLKYKSAKQIVSNNGIKKGIENAFKNLQQEYDESLDEHFQLSKLKDLLEEDIFYFYFNQDGSSCDSTYNEEMQLKLLQLKLKEAGDEDYLFFLSNYKKDGVVMEIDFLNPNDKEAENKSNFYGEVSYTFPMLDSLSSTELILTRKDLEKTTLEFREKINEWASICYANPNTNLGLEHFKNELQPFLESTQNVLLENPRLQHVSSKTKKTLESQIIIGEAPIEKIWELYLASETIIQEVFDDLIKIKAEQFPKFEGRWPVIFYRLTEDAVNFINSETENDGLQSVRKSISLD